MAYFDLYAGTYEFLGKVLLSIRTLWRKLLNKILLILIFISIIATWWQAFYIKSSLVSDLLVLRYKIDFGANLIGEPSLIYVYPLFYLLVVFMNLIISLSLYRSKSFALISGLLLAGTLVVGIFCSLYLFSVYLVNFR